jgi:hypothetical protein
MDQPKEYSVKWSYTKPGVYFIESDLYFPIRGNGWYSHVMVKYLVDNNLTMVEDIKYVMYSSLTAPKDYFNKFIDNIYEKNDGSEKFFINCVIGMCKPSKHENF